MRICFLYGNENALPLAAWLAEQGHEIAAYSARLDSLTAVGTSFDLLISFSYRYMIPGTVLDEVGGNAINLHLSFLPWNRGADPNIWSWLEDTPKGVTIHYMTEKLDGGDIIAQRLTHLSENETIRSSYDKLCQDIFSLFKDIFPLYSQWNSMRRVQVGRGSYHCSAELNKARSKIDYDMTTERLRELYHKEKCFSGTEK